MRNNQFWILMLFSTVVSLLMIKQIFLSRAIIMQQHVLVDSHETTETDSAYETAWQDLALRVYKASLQDPAMAALLKSEGITIHEGPPPGSAPPSTNSAPVPSTSSKPQTVPPSRPTTP